MAQSVLGEMVIKLTGDNAEFDSSIDKSKTIFDKFSDNIEKSDFTLKKLSDGAKKLGGDLTKSVTLPILALGTAAVKVAGDFEQQRIALGTLLGSVEKGNELFETLRKEAAATPFELKDLVKNTTTLKAFGVETENLLPYMRMLGDVALGDSNKFSQLSLAFAQIKASGKLMGQDLLQLINAGFNPLQVISEKTGRSISDLKDDMSKGAISFEQIADAFKSATSEGGKFYKASENASKTLNGQISTLKDNFSALLNEFGEALIPTVKDLIKIASEVISEFNKFDEGTKKTIITVAGLTAAIGPIISTIGAMLTPIGAVVAALSALGVIIATVGIATSNNNNQFNIAANAAKKESDEVNNLVKEYEFLASKTNLNVAEKYKLLEVENNLKKVLPETALVLDEQSKVIGINTQAVKEHLAELQKVERINLEEEVKRLKSEQTKVDENIKKSQNRLKVTLDAYKLDNISAIDRKIFGTDEIEARKKAAAKPIEDEILAFRKAALDLIEKQAEAQKRLNEIQGREPEKKQQALQKTQLTSSQQLALEVEKNTKKQIAAIVEYEKIYGSSIDTIKQKQSVYKSSIETLITSKEGFTANSAAVKDLALSYSILQEEITKTEVEDTKRAEASKKFEEDVRKQVLADIEAIKLKEENYVKLTETYKKYTDVVAGAIGPVFEALGAALVTGEAGWKAFAKAGLDAVAAVVDALANMAIAETAAEVAKALASYPDPVGIATHSAAAVQWGAAGALGKVVAGAIRAIPFADGGYVTKPTVGLLAEAGNPEFAIPDRPNVTDILATRILNGMGKMTGTVNNVTNNNQGFNGQMVLSIDGQQFKAYINQQSARGNIQISKNRGISRR